MNKKFLLKFFSLSLLLTAGCTTNYNPYYVFSVKGEKTYLNDQEILLKGLRMSNALISDEAVAELIAHIDTFAFYGLNSFSVYFMGSRFGDIKGYRKDASLDPVYAKRMSQLIEAADKKGFVVLVGCLYWSTSEAKWEPWTQKEADLAVANTVKWLRKNNYRNVFIDIDNEGMAMKARKFDPALMVSAARNIDDTYVIATNFKGDPPPEADMAIHHSNRKNGIPYAETEGSAPKTPGGYWGSYSKQGKDWNNGPDLYQYINIGIYTEEMKEAQIKASFEHFDRGDGYMMASTWLQCVPPEGPNHRPGGSSGTADDPGIRWWLQAVRDRYGAYQPPAPLHLKKK